LPLLPPVFNRVEYRLARRLHDPDASPLPRTRTAHLAEGLLLTSCGWLLLGASFWATLRAILGDVLPWTWEGWGRYTALLALAYVAGFVILVPAGLGVREFFLLAGLLTGFDEETRSLAGLAIVVLRVVWTVAELLVAGVLYWLPAPAAGPVGEAP
jgi:hypothetical protein